MGVDTFGVHPISSALKRAVVQLQRRLSLWRFGIGVALLLGKLRLGRTSGKQHPSPTDATPRPSNASIRQWAEPLYVVRRLEACMLGFFAPTFVVIILGDASMSESEVAARRYFLLFSAAVITACESTMREWRAYPPHSLSAHSVAPRRTSLLIPTRTIHYYFQGC